MIIKKFQAETETGAMELAKEELGKDAIVMNIKTIKPRGIYKLFKKSKVEVTAAIDESPTSKKEPEEKRAYQPPEAVIEESAIEKKLNDLQELLEKQMVVNAAGSIHSAKAADHSSASDRTEPGNDYTRAVEEEAVKEPEREAALNRAEPAFHKPAAALHRPGQKSCNICRRFPSLPHPA